MEDFCSGQKPSQNIKTEHFLTKEKTSTSNLTCWDKKKKSARISKIGIFSEILVLGCVKSQT